MTPEEFQKTANVSRETMGRLQIYAATLLQWQKKINLVGPSTVDDVWLRHIYDSAQLIPIIKTKLKRDPHSILDLGAGAGFPGLVLAIMTDWPVILAEANGKKCAFMRQVISATGATAEVRQARIEAAPYFSADIIVARALAELPDLLNLGSNYATQDTEYFFLKGLDIDKEVQKASIYWKMTVDLSESLSDLRGRIIHIRKVARHAGQQSN